MKNKPTTKYFKLAEIEKRTSEIRKKYFQISLTNHRTTNRYAKLKTTAMQVLVTLGKKKFARDLRFFFSF